MTAEEIRDFLKNHGWKISPFGHVTKGNIRLKLMKRVIRYEKAFRYDDGTKYWMRLKSAYYKNVRFNDDKTKLIVGWH